MNEILTAAVLLSADVFWHIHSEWRITGVMSTSSRLSLSGHSVAQWNENGTERPISFASSKLTRSQLSLAAIEKVAYAVVWALNKFRTWCFGVPVVIYSDSNPLTYLTSNATKSAILTRWSLALQEYLNSFKYWRGSLNIVPDFFITTMRGDRIAGWG